MFLGVNFKEVGDDIISASQSRYIDELAKQFRVTEAHPLTKLPLDLTLKHWTKSRSTIQCLIAASLAACSTLLL